MIGNERAREVIAQFYELSTVTICGMGGNPFQSSWWSVLLSSSEECVVSVVRLARQWRAGGPDVSGRRADY